MGSGEDALERVARCVAGQRVRGDGLGAGVLFRFGQEAEVARGAYVGVEGGAEGATADLLRFMQTTPLREGPGRATKAMSSSGVEKALCAAGETQSWPTGTPRAAAISAVTFGPGSTPP